MPENGSTMTSMDWVVTLPSRKQLKLPTTRKWKANLMMTKTSLVDLSSFKVGDKFRVYWSMAKPPEWFDGIVEKICAVKVKTRYLTSDSHYHHNTQTWDMIKALSLVC